MVNSPTTVGHDRNPRSPNERDVHSRWDCINIVVEVLASLDQAHVCDVRRPDSIKRSRTYLQASGEDCTCS